ncbi:hypothetical protein [Actinomadura sp. NEAU-AAG7]|uniref:SecDF P1 head subdomain-containing protein n=1 Tax=Actinomadura sp. NEAU-AAG7 TaxID=2839640 RepID=UPI001BE43970|nr:hypothetical protein [Actinomadura sp. NEAU-AAG7]MBT2210294.1 hypothetical protein [Actinomadura sp. NEAU-AAG7]
MPPTQGVPPRPAPPPVRPLTSRVSDGRTAPLPPAAPGAVPDSDQRRRERAAARRREAAEAKRSRAAQRARRPTAADRAAAQHRSALLVMVLTLGLLIAAVVVTGGMVAASLRTRPVTLASPLHIYPVKMTTPGQCPAGTPGITGQVGAGPTCYWLNRGIAIHKVADLRVQRVKGAPGYDVAVTLRPVDRRAFATLTRMTVGHDLAFVVRDRLVTLPRVDTAVLDGKVAVTGSPDRAAAERLVRELKGR